MERDRRCRRQLLLLWRGLERIRIAASAWTARMAACARSLRRWWRDSVAAPCRAAANMDMVRKNIVKLTLGMLCRAVPVIIAAYIGAQYAGGASSTILITLATVAVIAVGLLWWNMFSGMFRDKEIEALWKAHNDLKSAFERHVARYEEDMKTIRAALERIEKDIAELKSWRSEQMAHRSDHCGRSAT